MDQTDLDAFVSSVTRYFEAATNAPAEVGTPYLSSEGTRHAQDYTGIIGISGRSRGCVYFTASAPMLKHLVLCVGETDTSHDMLCDMVGEIANTISGNARSYFGAEFMVSVPVVVSGSDGTVRLPSDLRSFVIPISWKRFESALVVCLE